MVFFYKLDNEATSNPFRYFEFEFSNKTITQILLIIFVLKIIEYVISVILYAHLDKKISKNQDYPTQSTCNA